MSGGLTLRFVRAGAPGDDPGYDGERDLRYRVLRAPLGMPRGSEENAAEAACRHLVAEDASGRVLGCVIFRDDDGARGQLMQMAVAPELHGQGVGALLVRHLEAALVADGVREVILHARETAIGFYERLGYAVFDEPYVEVGIPHRNMRKVLSAK